MGFRFRKSIKILPGIRLNLSRSGVSASVGRGGATVNVSKRGARGTVGAPGTGLSYSENLTASSAPGRPRSGMSFAGLLGWALLVFILVVILIRLM